MIKIEFKTNTMAFKLYKFEVGKTLRKVIRRLENGETKFDICDSNKKIIGKAEFIKNTREAKNGKG